MQELILYSTLGCHLCELALKEIAPCLTASSFRIHEVDIADDESLMKLYGVKIPVLFYPEKNKCLYWPFDQKEVYDFLSD